MIPQTQNPSDQSKAGLLFSQFHEAIFDSFQNYNFKNAVFLAERLRNLQDNDNNTCLLAECYLTDNTPFKAYSVLKNCKSKRGRYLLAVAAFRINKMAEAETALTQENPNQKSSSTKLVLDNVINGSHGLYLLGQVSERLGKKSQALECYEKAFQKNPCLFGAFEKVNMLSASKETTQGVMSVLRRKPQSAVPSEIAHSVFKNVCQNVSREKENTGQAEATPNRKNQTLESNMFVGQHQKFQVKTFPKQTTVFAPTAEGGNVITTSLKKLSPKSKKKSTDPVGKLSFNNQTEPSLMGSTMAQSQFVTLASNSNSMINQQSNPVIAGPAELSSLQEYLFAVGVPYANLLCQNILSALEDFRGLKKPFDTDPWILANIGRCYTEISNHAEAEKYFKSCFEREPYRTENADYYSSCMWQLKRQIELPKFATLMLENHYFAPETWIAHANCYSLIQDHDSAITFLLRATQIDPFNSYANCLIGHEYVSKENFEKARDYYQKAIKLDFKNVRALFGLGSLELNAGKFQESIDNFNNAIKINNQCSTFYTQLGIAYKQKEAYEEALFQFNKAEEINPAEKINRFNKADVLFKIGKHHEALRECKRVLAEAKESTVYFLMGQINHKLGEIEEAHSNFEMAIKMDKKEASKIKKVIASLDLKDSVFEEV